jgi:hypothetical protein
MAARVPVAASLVIMMKTNVLLLGTGYRLDCYAGPKLQESLLLSERLISPSSSRRDDEGRPYQNEAL